MATTPRAMTLRVIQERTSKMPLKCLRTSRPRKTVRLRGVRNGSRSGEPASELREDGEVGVKPDSLKRTNAERP